MLYLLYKLSNVDQTSAVRSQYRVMSVVLSRTVLLIKTADINTHHKTTSHMTPKYFEGTRK